MSRRRSQSPRQRFRWEELDFDPYQVVSGLNRSPPDRNLCEEFRAEEGYSGSPRRPPFRWPHPSGVEGSTPAPRLEERCSPPPWDGGRAVERWQGFRPNFPRFDGRGRSSRSPARLPREQLPQAAPPHRGEGQGRGRGRFREPSPGGRSEEERVRRGVQRPSPPPLLHDRSPPFKRNRADSDEDHHPGFRAHQEIWGQGYSVDSPRGEFRGNSREGPPRRHGPPHRGDFHRRGDHHPRKDLTRRQDFHRRDSRQSEPIIIDHGHCTASSREPPHWEEAGRDGSRHKERSPERFRHDSSGHHFQDLHESRRKLPPPQDRSPIRFENHGGLHNHRGRGGSRPMRNRDSHNRGARAGLPKTQTRFPDFSQEDQEPSEERGGRYRPLCEDNEDGWVEPDRQQNPDRRHGWNRPKNDGTAVDTEETLTIKVDMSQPAPLNSALSYSADRQLSLDLVHVGRQRLDFLPMLEHSGTFHESNVHSGTFAQEIITLVHQVKDQYFGGGGLTLNQRFSAPPNSSCSEEESQELTLNRRFSSNRGFGLNISSLLNEDDEEPLLSRLPPVQGLNQPPVRGPGDLRHDLERRRQEKLEEVKVTIPGRSRTQRLPAANSEQQYGDRTPTERTGPRRGGVPHGPPSRNQTFTHRRPNFHSGSTGSDW